MFAIVGTVGNTAVVKPRPSRNGVATLTHSLYSPWVFDVPTIILKVAILTFRLQIERNDSGAMQEASNLT